MTRPSSSIRSASDRHRQIVSEDVKALEARAGFLYGELVALEARADSIEAYLSLSPLAGDRRFAEAAAVVAGSAVARTRNAGPVDAARAARDAARAVGSAEKISALLDLAGAAMAWAVILSIADDEQSAAMPARRLGRPGRVQLASGPTTGRRRKPNALLDIEEGRLTARDAFLGKLSAAQRRELGVIRIADIIDADQTVPLRVAYSMHPGTRYGSLSLNERHDLAAEVHQAIERRLVTA